MKCLADISLSHLLADESREAIYFDGALPLDKRETRLERLERSRVLLEAYRKQYPGPFEIDRSQDKRYFTKSSIWQHRLPGPRRTPALPHPPFMVACVLDQLKNSHFHEDRPDASSAIEFQDILTEFSMFGDLVHVVPGEADLYCATRAKATGAAVLSNDSDMVMHDLGLDGSLVLLNTIENVTNSSTTSGHDHHTEMLKLQRLQPARIAKRLGLKSWDDRLALLRLGFERATDSSASAGTVRNRCRAPIHSNLNESFDQFCSQYKSHEDIASNNGKLWVRLPIDPRVSELYCQYNHHAYPFSPCGYPHIYLPFLIEDPVRDSSWSYGRRLRTLAYSLLSLSDYGSSGGHEAVVEFQRRGSRIVGMPVEVLDTTESIFSLKTILRDLRSNLYGTDLLLQWQLFGFKEVIKQRRENGKLAMYASWVTEFLTKGYVGQTLSWDDVHFYANVQSVLYSLWILKQILAISQLQGELQTAILGIKQALLSLPPLTNLMTIQSEISTATRTVSKAMVAEIFQTVHSDELESQQPDTSDGQASTSSASKQAASLPGTRHGANYNIFEFLAAKNR